MATKLNTRILLRYDSYENWIKDTATVLLEGEVAICTVPSTGYPENKDDAGVTVQNPPKTLMKVGPGAFKDLPWLSAVAADVHTWAKKSEGDFKKWLTSTDGPSLATKAEVNKVASDLANLTGRVTTTESDIDALEGRMTTAEGKITTLEGKVSTLEGEMDTAQQDIVDLKAAVGTGDNGLAKRVADIESKNIAQDTTIENITKKGGAIDSAVAGEKSRAEGIEGGLRTDIDAVKADYLKAADKTELEGKITKEVTDRESAITGLKNELTAEIGKKANATEVYTKNEADAAFMTQTEVRDYIDGVVGDLTEEETTTGIVSLVEYVRDNAADLAGLTKTVDGHTTSLSTVAGQISALQTKDTNLDADIKAINNKIGNDTLAEGETIISIIAANDVKAQGYATAAQSNAKDYTDAEIVKVNTAAGTLSSTVAGHTALLKGIEGTTVKADINTAQAAAEKKVTDLANGQVNTNKLAIEAINNEETGILAKANAHTNTEIGKVNSALAGEKTARENFDKTALTGKITKNANNENELAISLNGAALEIIFDCGGATAHFTA